MNTTFFNNNQAELISRAVEYANEYILALGSDRNRVVSPEFRQANMGKGAWSRYHRYIQGEVNNPVNRRKSQPGSLLQAANDRVSDAIDQSLVKYPLLGVPAGGQALATEVLEQLMFRQFGINDPANFTSDNGGWNDGLEILQSKYLTDPRDNLRPTYVGALLWARTLVARKIK